MTSMFSKKMGDNLADIYKKKAGNSMSSLYSKNMGTLDTVMDSIADERNVPRMINMLPGDGYSEQFKKGVNTLERASSCAQCVGLF